MAGICAGPGLTTEPGTGYLMVQGPRPGTFPAGCNLAAENALRADPITGALWVAPQASMRTAVAPVFAGPLSVPGNNSNPVTALNASVSTTMGGCATGHGEVSMTAGHVEWAAVPGNAWELRRRLVVTIGAATVLDTGVETVVVARNAPQLDWGSLPPSDALRTTGAGGGMGAAYLGRWAMTPGQTITATTTWSWNMWAQRTVPYQLFPPAGQYQHFIVRAPQLRVSAVSVPLL